MKQKGEATMQKLSKAVSAAASIIGLAGALNIAQASPVENGRTPVRVEQTSRTNTAYYGPTNWGHETLYGLKVVEANGDHYGLGTPYEAFGATTYSTNATLRSDLQAIGVPGTPTGPTDPWPQGATFTDRNYTVLDHDTGVNTFWYSFPQIWHTIRVSDSHDFTLNTHTVNHFQGYVTRNY